MLLHPRVLSKLKKKYVSPQDFVRAYTITTDNVSFIFVKDYDKMRLDAMVEYNTDSIQMNITFLRGFVIFENGKEISYSRGETKIDIFDVKGQHVLLFDTNYRYL